MFLLIIMSIIQNEHDTLHCQLEGSKELLLVDTRQHPEVLNLLDIPNPPFGRASFMNTLSVDLDKYPDVEKISMFHIALLAPGKELESSKYTKCLQYLSLIPYITR